MAKPTLPTVAVLGAGPVGIEAALFALASGLTVTVYERGDTGEQIGKWGHVKMFTPFGRNVSPLGLERIRKEHPTHPIPASTDLLTGTDYRDAYLTPLSMTEQLGSAIRTKTEVLHIGRSGLLHTDPADDPRRRTAKFVLLVKDAQNAERLDEADVILDCTGTYGTHAWLGNGGIPAIGERAAQAHIAYGLEDVLGSRKAQYAGKSIIVIGAGYSAATTVCALAQLAEQNAATWIIWLTRSGRSTPLPRNPSDPYRERDRLAAKANSLAARGEGNIEYHASALVQSVTTPGPDKGFRVTAKLGNQATSWEVDRVIANIGHRPDENITRELHTAGVGVLRPEPGYYVLGMKRAGRTDDFFLADAQADIRTAFRAMLGKQFKDF